MGGVAVDCNACRSMVKFNCFRIARFEQPGEKKAFYLNRPDFSATLDAWNNRSNELPPSDVQGERIKKLTEQLAWIHRWVERGIFDVETSPMDALNVIAHAPDAFWKTGTWDVDHLPYASKFYDNFPNARPKNDK
jgi:hypothetical protein